jgi:hypothetical protein
MTTKVECRRCEETGAAMVITAAFGLLLRRLTCVARRHRPANSPVALAGGSGNTRLTQKGRASARGDRHRGDV